MVRGISESERGGFQVRSTLHLDQRATECKQTCSRIGNLLQGAVIVSIVSRRCQKATTKSESLGELLDSLAGFERVDRFEQPLGV